MKQFSAIASARSVVCTMLVLATATTALLAQTSTLAFVQASPSSVAANGRIDFTLTVKNTGTTAWTGSPYTTRQLDQNIAPPPQYNGYFDVHVVAYKMDSTNPYTGYYQAFYALPSIVSPNQTITISDYVIAPPLAGQYTLVAYTEHLGHYAFTSRVLNSAQDAYNLSPRFDFTIGGVCTPPVITTQPQSQSVSSGQSPTLSVTATGTGLSYQWFRGLGGDTGNPVGNNAASYTVTNITTSAAYWVRVTNNCGSSNSATATISVQTTAPATAASLSFVQASPKSLGAGGRIDFTLTIKNTGANAWTGSPYTTRQLDQNVAPPPQYNGYFDVHVVAYKMDSTNPYTGYYQAFYALPSTVSPNQTVTISDYVLAPPVAGQYTLVAYTEYLGHYAFTSRTLNSAQDAYNLSPHYDFSVTQACTPPSISFQPEPKTIASGETAVLMVNANGTQPVTWQWYQGTSGDTTKPVAGANANMLVTPALTSTTQFWARASNTCGSANSNTVTITVLGCTISCNASAPSTAYTNEPITFSATATTNNCTASPTYVWDFGDNTTATTKTATHAYNDNGTYQWSLQAQSATAACTKNGNITIEPSCTPPSITTQPQNQTIQTGQIARLSVTANGTQLQYQWYQGTTGDTSRPVGNNSNTFTAPALTSTTTYWVRVSNNCGSKNTQTATITIQTSPKPTFTADGVVNAASFQPGIVAGSLAVMFGTNLASTPAQAQTTPWPTTLGGTSVLVGGVVAPLYYASSGQINFQVPWEVAGQTGATVVVMNNSVVSDGVNVTVLVAQPALLTSTGKTALIQHGTTYQLVNTGSPAKDGETIIVYATGLGPVVRAPQTGYPVAVATPTTLTASVTIGGEHASVAYAGLSSVPGLYQLNVTMPKHVPSGDIPVTIQLTDGDTAYRSKTAQLAAAGNAISTDACLIFVHGSTLDDYSKGYGYDWFGDWQTGRDYWRNVFNGFTASTVSMNSADDFVAAATDSFRRPYAIVRYNGAAPYWSAEAAGIVTNQILAATSTASGSCSTKDGRRATRFWIVAHSMGATVMDYILGNAINTGDRHDPHFNEVCAVVDGEMGSCTPNSADFATAAARIAGVFSVGGAHKGSPLADGIFKQISCFNVAGIVGSFTDLRTDTWRWLQTDATRLVESYSNSPAKPVFLMGGFREWPTAATASCLSLLNDGILPFASQYACAGDPNASYTTSTLCSNAQKQQRQNFINVDTANEYHLSENNTAAKLTTPRTRYAIADGLITGSPGQKVADDCSSATQIDSLLKGSLLDKYLQ